jgi:hypothetical protein
LSADGPAGHQKWVILVSEILDNKNLKFKFNIFLLTGRKIDWAGNFTGQKILLGKKFDWAEN